ncbi:MAG: hypothetical protein AB1668_04415 [Nanoarchaeota archaeon]
METYSQVLVFLLSFGGTFFGVALSRIAPEEIAPGKKYFLLLKRILFMLIFVVVIFFAFKDKSYYMLSFFALFSGALFVFEWKYSSYKENMNLKDADITLRDEIVNLKDDLKEDLKLKPLKYLSCVYYLLLFSPYFLIQNDSFKLLLASLVFLYGFPLGTLLAGGGRNRQQ